jgi:hypothetical protein
VKKLDEKLSLLRLSEGFGIAPDPKLLEEIAYLKAKQAKKQKQQKELTERVHAAGQALFEPVIKAPEVTEPEPVQPEPVALTEEVLITPPVIPQSNVDIVSKYIKKESTLVNPEPVLAQPTPVLEQKVKQLEAWISRIAATGSGSGEVNFRWLDDVDRSSIDQNKYLAYNPTSKKFQFEDTRVSIEAFDRSTSIALTSTPQLLKPNSFTNSKNLTYDTSNGVFTFLTQCEVALALTVNAVSAGSNHRVYQYAERNTGSGWQPIVNSGKNFQLVNGQNTQIVNAQTISRLAGEQIRYFIYSDSADKVTLITETLPATSGYTVYVPAIRIQYAGR